MIDFAVAGAAGALVGIAVYRWLAQWLADRREQKVPFGWVPWTVKIGDQVCCTGRVPVDAVADARDSMLAGLRSVADNYHCTGPQGGQDYVRSERGELDVGLAADEPAGRVDDEACGECRGRGVLVNWGYDDVDLPPGSVPVERCDACQAHGSDEDAAIAVAEAWGTEMVETPVLGGDRRGEPVFCVYLPPAPQRIESWDGRWLYVNELGWVVEEVVEDQPEAPGAA